MYQIYVSGVNETRDISTPFTHKQYSLSNLTYYLAATYNGSTFPLQYIFENSEESVDGLDGKFNTIGRYYLHIRAVILGKVRFK